MHLCRKYRRLVWKTFNKTMNINDCCCCSLIIWNRAISLIVVIVRKECFTSSCRHQLIMLLILTMNRVTDKLLSLGIGVHTGTTVPWGYRYNGEKYRCQTVLKVAGTFLPVLWIKCLAADIAGKAEKSAETRDQRENTSRSRHPVATAILTAPR